MKLTPTPTPSRKRTKGKSIREVAGYGLTRGTTRSRPSHTNAWVKTSTVTHRRAGRNRFSADNRIYLSPMRAGEATRYETNANAE